MVILQDSREKDPLMFVSPEVCKTKICKLIVGDYTIEYENGERSEVFFERKSLPDLFGSLGKGYPRFREEVLRARVNSITLILIVECSLMRVLRGYEHSTISGISIIKTIFSLWVRYGLVPVFCKDREEASQYITHYFAAEWRHKKTLTKSKIIVK